MQSANQLSSTNLVNLFKDYLRSGPGKELIESTLIAKWTGRQHKDVIKSIRLNQAIDKTKEFNQRPDAPVSFFAIESEYTDKKGESRTCFLLDIDAAINVMTSDAVLRRDLQRAAKQVTQEKLKPVEPDPLEALDKVGSIFDKFERIGLMDDRLKLGFKDLSSMYLSRLLPSGVTPSEEKLYTIVEYLLCKHEKRPESGREGIVGKAILSVWLAEGNEPPKKVEQLFRGRCVLTNVYPESWLDDMWNADKSIFE